MRKPLALLFAISMQACGSDAETPPAVTADTGVASDASDTSLGDGSSDTTVSPDTPTDTGSGSETSPPPPDGSDDVTTAPGTIRCNGATCSASTEICCGADVSKPPACVAKTSCTGTAYECSSKASCTAGLVCCVGGTGGGSRCVATCPTTVLCDSVADCKGGEACKPTVFGFKACTKG